MDEFSLIDFFFKTIPHRREDVVFGIGDDAACLQVPAQMQLLVSCDTLVADVHFLSTWDAFDIAYKAVMVNVSDIAAMGGSPAWITLALTLPVLDKSWLDRFSKGLQKALSHYNIALIGGDTTRGPLSLTLTIHGFVPQGKAVRRNGARPGDKIYVSGELGSAAFALATLDSPAIPPLERAFFMEKLHYPTPRLDLASQLQSYATAAIDISDGLTADLQHICKQSQVGARIMLESIPLHPFLFHHDKARALDFALSGGDDYELCFTVAPQHEADFLTSLQQSNVQCYSIGVIEKEPGLRGETSTGSLVSIDPKGYQHFSSCSGEKK